MGGHIEEVLGADDLEVVEGPAKGRGEGEGGEGRGLLVQVWCSFVNALMPL